jgi:hypothetical protein
MTAEQSYEEAQAIPFTDPLHSPTRRRDGVRFAIELQRKYFRRMMDALHSMGVHVPCTGVVAGKSIPDTYSAQCEFDFTAENMYQEHPEYEPGREWLPPAYYHDTNYMATTNTESGIPFVARYKWAGKPLAVREWATCWPNQYRAASMLEMASYGRMEDWDCLLYFAYFTTGDFTRLSSFAVNNDPARWSLFGVAAKVFLDSSVLTGVPELKQVGYTMEDLYAYSSWENHLYEMAYYFRLENVLSPPGSSADFNDGRTGEACFGRFMDARQKQRNPMSPGEIGVANILATVGWWNVHNAVTRDPDLAKLSVSAPRFACVEGLLLSDTNMTSDLQLKVTTSSPFAVVTALSLDDQPLTASKHYLLKMVTVAENRKQLLEPSKNPAMKNMKVMVTEGTTPIVTRGDYDATGTRVMLGGNEIVHAQMVKGTWELLVDEEKRTAYLWCDLPNAEFTVHIPGASAYTLTAYQNEPSTGAQPHNVGVTFKYPGWAKYARLQY